MKTLVRLIVVACFAGAAFAQQPNQPPNPGPELQKLQLWVGDWTYEGESQTTFLGPGEKYTGRVTGRSILNGYGLESVFHEQSPSGETQTVEVDTYDPATKSYPYISVSSDGSFSQGSFTVNGSVATYEGTTMVGGNRYKARGTDAVAPDGMSGTMRGEISVDGKTWVLLYATKSTKVQDSEKSAVEATLREFEQAVHDYNFAKADTLVAPEGQWIEHSLLEKWKWTGELTGWWQKAKAAGIRSNFRLHDFETHVQGDVAWVTVTLDATPSADNEEGKKLLLSLPPDADCSSQGTYVSCNATIVESMVLVKTPSGWKIALGYGSRLPKAQK